MDQRSKYQNELKNDCPMQIKYRKLDLELLLAVSVKEESM